MEDETFEERVKRITARYKELLQDVNKGNFIRRYFRRKQLEEIEELLRYMEGLQNEDR